uniref:Uncharacterized protein n=1 Tax=Oryza barthii TaxID=65489 RepID=A0A0D3EV88_9ORYZ
MGAGALGVVAMVAAAVVMGRDCRRAAAVALWESAECHMRDFDPDDEQTSRAIESDLKRSVRMLVLENQPQLAASACEELARMYVARRRWTEAREWYERAAGYYADTGEPYCIQLCRPRALQEAVSAAVRGAVAAMLGPVQMSS